MLMCQYLWVPCEMAVRQEGATCKGIHSQRQTQVFDELT